MAATVNVYPSGLRLLQSGGIDLDTDTLKVSLHTNSYTFQAAHDYADDLTNEVATGSGYTAGGVTVGSVSLTTTVANSWATTWAAATAYTVGVIIRPTVGNGWVYYCVVAGTSHATTEPTWSTIWGVNNTDGTATWVAYGRGVTVFDAGDALWPLATFTARKAVLRKDTGTAGTSPLLACQTESEDKVGGGGDFTVVWPAGGIWAAAAA
jgi:hypothetical protein